MSKILATHLDSALKLGRTARQVIDILEDDEVLDVLGAYIKLANDPLTSATLKFNLASNHMIPNHAGVMEPVCNIKIMAIKHVRNITGIGLKEAKDFVEGTHMSFDALTHTKLKHLFGDAVNESVPPSPGTSGAPFA